MAMSMENSKVMFNSEINFLTENNKVIVNYDMKLSINDDNIILHPQAEEKLTKYLKSSFFETNVKKENNNLPYNLSISIDSKDNNYHIKAVITFDYVNAYAYGFSFMDDLKEVLKDTFEKYFFLECLTSKDNDKLIGINLSHTSVSSYEEVFSVSGFQIVRNLTYFLP
ncbi:MAG: hypothetical protein RMJ67_01235 [Elusimicrobiota bacterium]|nr:hypothetical protein [Endomicrobiia bacterium]MDW8165127.1 hypothetical protein [Elusimicrobiota bacterium]